MMMYSTDRRGVMKENMGTETAFEKEIQWIINRHSQENISNTPDFILAQYLLGCLATFNTAVQQRETWHGRNAMPKETKR